MEINARIVGLVPFEVLGDPYYTVYYAHEDDLETILQAQLPADAIYPEPHPNDRIRVRYLGQVVTRIRRREPD